jgi:hypothetical protein
VSEKTKLDYKAGIWSMRSTVVNGRMTKNRAVTGISSTSVTGTVGIQDNVLIDTMRILGLDVMHSLNLLTMGGAVSVEIGKRKVSADG